MKFFFIISLSLFLIACNQNQNASGGSLHFDGIDDHIVVPNFKQLQINEGTLEAWIKITQKNDADWYAIAAKEKAYELTLFHYKLAGYDWNEGKIYAVGDTIQTNVWYHMALVFKNNVKKGCQLYINGKPIGEPFEISILTQGTELFVGGNSFNPQYFNGCIDEFRVWNRVRSAEEIYSTYKTEIDPLSKGLVLYYKFNDAIAGGDNTDNVIIKDETLYNSDGNLSKFNLNGKTSNFVSDSPLLPKSHRSIKFFIYKNWEIILIVICVIIFSIFFINSEIDI